MNINQTKRKHGKILYTVIILTLIFIWGNSLLNAEISSYISDFFKDIILSVFPFAPSGEAEGAGGVRQKTRSYNRIRDSRRRAFVIFPAVER